MENKSTFKRFRDALQQGIYCIINPFVRLLIKIGVTPNVVTTIGLLGNIAAAAVFVAAAMKATPGTDYQYKLVTVAARSSSHSRCLTCLTDR